MKDRIFVTTLFWPQVDPEGWSMYVIGCSVAGFADNVRCVIPAATGDSDPMPTEAAFKEVIARAMIVAAFAVTAVEVLSVTFADFTTLYAADLT